MGFPSMMFLHILCTRQFFERRINGQNGIDVGVGNLSTFVLCDDTETFTVEEFLVLRSLLPAPDKGSGDGDAGFKVVRVGASKPEQKQKTITEEQLSSSAASRLPSRSHRNPSSEDIDNTPSTSSIFRSRNQRNQSSEDIDNTPSTSRLFLNRNQRNPSSEDIDNTPSTSRIFLNKEQRHPYSNDPSTHRQHRHPYSEDKDNTPSTCRLPHKEHTHPYSEDIDNTPSTSRILLNRDQRNPSLEDEDNTPSTSTLLNRDQRNLYSDDIVDTPSTRRLPNRGQRTPCYEDIDNTPSTSRLRNREQRTPCYEDLDDTPSTSTILEAVQHPISVDERQYYLLQEQYDLESGKINQNLHDVIPNREKCRESVNSYDFEGDKNRKNLHVDREKCLKGGNVLDFESNQKLRVIIPSQKKGPESGQEQKIETIPKTLVNSFGIAIPENVKSDIKVEYESVGKDQHLQFNTENPILKNFLSAWETAIFQRQNVTVCNEKIDLISSTNTNKPASVLKKVERLSDHQGPVCEADQGFQSKVDNAKRQPAVDITHTDPAAKFCKETSVSENVRSDLRTSIMRRRSIEGKGMIDLTREENERQEQMKKYRMTSDELRKAEQRKWKNRQSAKICRMKKRCVEGQLTEELNTEMVKNKNLRKVITTFMNKKVQMQNYLLSHVSMCRKGQGHCHASTPCKELDSAAHTHFIASLMKSTDVKIEEVRSEENPEHNSHSNTQDSVSNDTSDDDTLSSIMSDFQEMEATNMLEYPVSADFLNKDLGNKLKRNIEDGRERAMICDKKSKLEDVSDGRYSFTTYSEHKLGSVKEREILRELEFGTYKQTDTADVIETKTYGHQSLSCEELPAMENPEIIESLQAIRNIMKSKSCDTTASGKEGRSSVHVLNRKALMEGSEVLAAETEDKTNDASMAEVITKLEADDSPEKRVRIKNKARNVQSGEEVVVQNVNETHTMETESDLKPVPKALSKLGYPNNTKKDIVIETARGCDGGGEEQLAETSRGGLIMDDNGTQAASKVKTKKVTRLEHGACPTDETESDSEDEADLRIISLHSPGRLVVDVDA